MSDPLAFIVRPLFNDTATNIDIALISSRYYIKVGTQCAVVWDFIDKVVAKALSGSKTVPRPVSTILQRENRPGISQSG